MQSIHLTTSKSNKSRRSSGRTYKTSGAYTRDHQGVDPDPKMSLIVDLIIKSGVSKSTICQKSGVSKSTIDNWLKGKTKRPQRQTVEFILKVIGLRLVIINKDDEIVGE